jgi:LuxR family maltose regulon positive regulatory protein
MSNGPKKRGIVSEAVAQAYGVITKTKWEFEGEKMKLILEKITIPSQLPRVTRVRLLEKLHRSIHCCAASVIHGRVGTGKTLLAADFAWGSGRRVAWFKVDASDAILEIFFQYLIESINRQRPVFNGQAVKCLVEEVSKGDFPSLAERFVYALQEHSDDPLLVVIEDLHLIYDTEWVAPFFTRLLPLLPPDVHMLITCRSMLPLPLWRMRSKQMLCVIEETELGGDRRFIVELRPWR